jgi:hypothetical protein
MVDITAVLTEKYPDLEWKIDGDPETEAEFNEAFEVLKGTPPAWADIEAGLIEMQASYDALEYGRSRASEYPSWEDQLDDIFHNGIDGWKASIQVVKDKYPKP